VEIRSHTLNGKKSRPGEGILLVKKAIFVTRQVSFNKEVPMGKILCIDENQLILQLSKEELSDNGYEILPAKDGKDGVWKYENEQIFPPWEAKAWDTKSPNLKLLKEKEREVSQKRKNQPDLEELSNAISNFADAMIIALRNLATHI
jgi:CheY-like chemotaxis protein